MAICQALSTGYRRTGRVRKLWPSRMSGSRDRIARRGGLPPHRPVKGGKMCPSATLSKKTRPSSWLPVSLQQGCDELVDAGAILLRPALELCRDRARQAERIDALVLHVLILRITSRAPHPVQWLSSTSGYWSPLRRRRLIQPFVDWRAKSAFQTPNSSFSTVI